jgi:hypothetical protein
MSDEKKNIDLLFRESIKGFRIKSPPHAWERLDRDLNALARKKNLFYYRLVAASLLVLLAFGAGYFYATYNTSESLLTDGELYEPKTVQDDEAIFLSPENESPESYSELKSSSDPKSALGSEEVEKKERTNQSDSESQPFKDYSKLEENNFRIKSAIRMIEPLKISMIELHEISPGHNIYNAAMDEAEKIIKEPVDLSVFFYASDNYHYDPVPPADASQLKWTVGAQFAPTYSYREISTNYEHSGIGGTDYTDELNNAEEALLSYSGGVNIDFKTGKRWGLQTGLYYARIGQVNNDALDFELVNNEYQLVAINTSTGFIDIAYERVPDEVKKISPPKDDIGELQLDNVSLIQQFDLFEVPFLIKYRLVDARFFINMAGGLTPAYLLKNHSWLEVEGEKHDIGLAMNLNSIIVNSSIGIGFGYDISSRLSFNLEPTFRYALNPINKNSEVFYHPYYLSWFTGINYKF